MKATKIFILIIMSIILMLNLASALTISSVTSKPGEIAPGEYVDIDITIENNLNNDVEDVSVTLDLTGIPMAPYESSNERTLNDIKEDKEKDVSFRLIAFSDAEPGTYKIPVKISYTLDSERIIGKGEGVIGIIINAEPKLEMTVEDTNLIKGTNTKIKVSITNSGLGGTKFLSVKAKDTTGIKILGPDSIYIGSIDSDDFETAEFDVFVSENAPSRVSFPVELNYLNARNKEVTESENLMIKTYSENEAVKLGLIKKSNTFAIIAVIVILVILILVYRAIRRRLKKKKQELV